MTIIIIRIRMMRTTRDNFYFRTCSLGPLAVDRHLEDQEDHLDFRHRHLDHPADQVDDHLDQEGALPREGQAVGKQHHLQHHRRHSHLNNHNFRRLPSIQEPLEAVSSASHMSGYAETLSGFTPHLSDAIPSQASAGADLDGSTSASI